MLILLASEYSALWIALWGCGLAVLIPPSDSSNPITVRANGANSDRAPGVPSPAAVTAAVCTPPTAVAEAAIGTDSRASPRSPRPEATRK